MGNPQGYLCCSQLWLKKYNEQRREQLSIHLLMQPSATWEQLNFRCPWVLRFPQQSEENILISSVSVVFIWKFLLVPTFFRNSWAGCWSNLGTKLIQDSTQCSLLHPLLSQFSNALSFILNLNSYINDEGKRKAKVINGHHRMLRNYWNFCSFVCLTSFCLNPDTG